MSKDEYLKLAREKGWDKHIPEITDGTYDCDIFGGDNVSFCFNVFISGNLSLGDYADICGISIGGSATFGINADTGDVYALGDIVFDSNAIVGTISADGDVIISQNAETGNINSRNIIVGAHSSVSSLFAKGIIIIDNIKDSDFIYALDEVIYADEPD